MQANDWTLINMIMDEMCPLHTMYRDAEYLLPDSFTESEHYHILSSKATVLYNDGVLTFIHYDLSDAGDRERVIDATTVCNAQQYLNAVQKFFNEHPEEVPTIFYQ